MCLEADDLCIDGGLSGMDIPRGAPGDPEIRCVDEFVDIVQRTVEQGQFPGSNDAIACPTGFGFRWQIVRERYLRIDELCACRLDMFSHEVGEVDVSQPQQWGGKDHGFTVALNRGAI